MFYLSGTFFQPFINGINTFFNPSQFRNPLDQFRNQQQSQQPQPQRGQQQQFTSFPAQPQQQQQTQQFGSSQQTFNFQDFRNNPTFQQDFQLTRFPQVSSKFFCNFCSMDQQIDDDAELNIYSTLNHFITNLSVSQYSWSKIDLTVSEEQLEVK